MTRHGTVPAAGRKQDRFIIHEGDIEVTGHRPADANERDEADRLFGRILKNRKLREK